MGQIGDISFVPDLIRVVRDTDGLSYIHEDAIRALNGIDEVAHESLLSAIQDGELTNPWDNFSLLEHLPYSESFDIAIRLWNKGGMDSEELYAICLEGIGDSRGIEALQKIFFEGNAVLIGDSLEVLSLLYRKDIPELETIHREKEIDKERQKRRKNTWTELISEKNNHRVSHSNVATIHRKTPKVGRNAPCPCGSGKKYKKCCINK